MNPRDKKTPNTIGTSNTLGLKSVTLKKPAKQVKFSPKEEDAPVELYDRVISRPESVLREALNVINKYKRSFQ